LQNLKALISKKFTLESNMNSEAARFSLRGAVDRDSRPTKIKEGEERNLDAGVVGGIALSLILLFVAALAGGNFARFINPVGLLIVVGGTFGATLVTYSLYDINQAWRAFKEAVFLKEFHPLERIVYLVELSQLVRREGLLVLEEHAQEAQDPFLAKGLEITVDGHTPDSVKRILENEIRTSHERERKGVNVFQTMGTYAPAMGLIGTLIGLVNLLGSLDDPAQVGPAMSVALMTTLYGAILANLIFLPIAGKLRLRSDEEAKVKAITVEGILALGREENPLLMEQRLQSFLPEMEYRI
ncbi:MAG: motility protein A, partial [Bdellovibrionales bacterium]|nr:motility protein A [Bdellovibrionales bacterium]